MSESIVIDPGELREDAPFVAEMYRSGVETVTRLGGLDTSVEMPPGLQGHVVGVLTGVGATLRSATEAIQGDAEALNRVAGHAEIADRVRVLGTGLSFGPGLYGGTLGAAAHLEEAIVGTKSPTIQSYAKWAKGAGYVLGGAGVLLAGAGTGLTNMGDRNPYLTGGQKRERIAGSMVFPAGSLGTALAVGAVNPLAGLAVGVTLGVAQLGFGDELSAIGTDLVEGTVDTVEWGAGAVEDLATDPVGTTTDAAEDIGGAVKDEVIDIGMGIAGIG